MVPEEEYENVSDDEISIDVPVGSPNSLKTLDGSVASIQQDFGSTNSVAGSMYSSKDDEETVLNITETNNSEVEADWKENNKATEREIHKMSQSTDSEIKHDDDNDSNVTQKKISTANKSDTTSVLNKKYPRKPTKITSKDKDYRRNEIKNDQGSEVIRKKTVSESSDLTSSTQSITNFTSDSESSAKEEGDMDRDRKITEEIVKSDSDNDEEESDNVYEDDEDDEEDETESDEEEDDQKKNNGSSSQSASSLTYSFAEDNVKEHTMGGDAFQDIKLHDDSDKSASFENFETEGQEGNRPEISTGANDPTLEENSTYKIYNATHERKHNHGEVFNVKGNKTVLNINQYPQKALKNEVLESKEYTPKGTKESYESKDSSIRISPDDNRGGINIQDRRNFNENIEKLAASSLHNSPRHSTIGIFKIKADTEIEDKGTKLQNGIQDTERGVSVSNILLDSKSFPRSPTVELSHNNNACDQTERIEKCFHLPNITDKDVVTSPEINTDTIQAAFNDSEPDTENRPGELTLLKTKRSPETTSDGDLSPISDIEYDYNRRRGSHLKIKLEGRRRQRLSISESEPSKSPTDLKQFEADATDGDFLQLVSAPLLDKRKKMDKSALKDYADKTPSVSPTSPDPMNTVIGIQETAARSLTYDAKCISDGDTKNSLKFPTKIVQNNNARPVKNINSLNTALIAIYNSSAIEKIEIPEKRQHSEKGITTTASQKQNDEDYFEGYHLLKSCNQALATQDSVTDINQLIVKTRQQTTSGTCGPRQDFNSDSISNNLATDNKDNKNNVETKSLLLPKRNETGNCRIKESKKYAIEHDRLSRNCEHKQLSLRQNAHKSNEINEANFSIEQSLSHVKQKKIKTLSKRQTYEDLHERKVLSASFSRGQSEVNTVVDIQHSQKSQVPASSDLHLKIPPVSVKREKRAENAEKINDYTEEGYIKQDGSLSRKVDKNKTGENRGLNMSARLFRSQEEMPGFTDRAMSGRLHRTQSALTDTARLRDIRKLLKLPDDNEEKSEKKSRCDQETMLIIQDIIDQILANVYSHRTTNWQSAMKTHRCTTTDEQGEEVLCCLLQTSSNDVDPSLFTCDVIDPVDTCPITKKHEHLVSNVVRISSHVTFKEEPEEGLVVSIPISHWYVEPWQEIVIKLQDANGNWKGATEHQANVVKIDDVEKVYYGVRHFLTGPCSLAVVSRPRVTSVLMANHDQVVNAVTDDRVKVHVFASDETKCVTMQVVPIEQSLLSKFSETEANQKACIVVASSPLLQISVSENEPESLAFNVPYVSLPPYRLGAKSPVSRSSPPYLRTCDHGSRDVSSHGLLSPYLSPAQSPRRSTSTRRLSDAARKGDINHLAFHLAQIDDDDDVKVKLLRCGNDKKAIDIVTEHVEEQTEGDEQTVKFSVYDKAARLIALQTKGSLEYSDVEKVTKAFVNFIVKHKVTLRVSQDPRNVYSILFTALVDHQHKEEDYNFKQTYKNFTTTYRKVLQIYEGDIVAISFRGNVDVPEKEKLIYSFHGCRGIRRHFDIQVSNPMSQRSLQTYHGALQLFTLKSQRYSGLDRSLAPCSKNGWELSAEFPLLLPKYLKSTPVIINKAPVSLRFHEPLTVDFVRTICSDLVNDWTQFAKALGISHARVQAIKQHHRNQVSDKVLMDVIINWMKTQRISQDKVTPLISALRLCNRPKLASELAYRYSAQRVTRTKTTRDKSLQRAFSLIGKSSSVTARWRQLLHHLCQNEGSHVIDATKEIDEKYNDEATRCQHALDHWKTTAATPSVWKIVDALRASRCDIVADTIVTMESKRK